MAEYQIAEIPGDGVGPEVIAEGKKVLEALAGGNKGLKFKYTDYPWGSDYYRETGLLMPEDGIEQLQSSDAILFGAVGDPQIPDHITLHDLTRECASGLPTCTPAWLRLWRGKKPGK